MTTGGQTSAESTPPTGRAVAVFLSYRRETDDSQPYADPICAALRARFGENQRVFIDVDSIGAGPWKRKIERAIKRSQVMVALIGTRWLETAEGVRRLDDENDIVRWELECAKKRGVQVIPVRVNRAALPRPGDLPEPLRWLPSQQAVEVVTGVHYSDSIGLVVKAVEQAASDHFDERALDRVEDLAATAVEQIESRSADAARETVDSAEAASQEIVDEDVRDEALEILEPVRTKLERLDAELARGERERRDRERVARVGELLAAARELLRERAVADARGKVETARATAEEIDAAEAREAALADVADVESDIAALRERVRELVAHARRHAQAGRLQEAAESAGAAREAADDLAAGAAREDAQADVADVEREIRNLEDVERRARVQQLVATARQAAEAGGAADARATLAEAEAVAERISDDAAKLAAQVWVSDLAGRLHGLREAIERGDFDAAELIEGARGTARRGNGGAAKEPGEPDHVGKPGGRSVWYRWTAPGLGRATIDTFGSDFDTLLAVYTGSTLPTLKSIAVNDDAGGGIQSQVQFAAEAGAEYMIAVDGYGGAAGEIVLNWALQDPPSNSAFAAAEEIAGESGTTRGDNTSAVNEPDEPEHAGTVGGGSLWYRWTAPGDGTATINTFGSEFDTLLAVYTGSTLPMLTLVAANDDAGGGTQSQVQFLAEAGAEYMIAVDGYSGSAGAIVLNWELRVGEATKGFLSAEPISGESGTTRGANAGASKEPGEPAHAGNAGGNSVWYRWTAPRDGMATIDTFGSDFDTLLAVYTGSTVATLTLVAANDDAGGTQSRVQFRAEAGAEYMIAVDGYGGATGAVVLNWEVQASLDALLRATGLHRRAEGHDTWAVPFGGPGSREAEVLAAEVDDGLALFAVQIPEPTFGVKRMSYQQILRVSYAADYVKAVRLPSGKLAFRIEQRLAALTPSGAEGLIRSLVPLGDLKPSDLVDGSGWKERLANCTAAQTARIHVDADSVPTALQSGGYSFERAPGGPYRVDVPLGAAAAPVDIVTSERAISFRLSLRIRPGASMDKLGRLVELNAAADVAKVGIDGDGDVVLLFEVPGVYAGVLDDVRAQFTTLLAGVLALE